MSIPTGTSVPGAELVLRVPGLAPDPRTTVIVNCAGRTRSIIGAQSLINAGLTNRVVALRNGTIGWKLAGQALETGQQRRALVPSTRAILEARGRARDVAYRSGVRHVGRSELEWLQRDSSRTTYFFDVRTPEEYSAGHLPDFRSAPGGQLVQETDFFAPVRGARIVLSDDLGARAEMTASWLAQMAWDVYVVESAVDERVSGQSPQALPPRSSKGRYKRPYEGTDSPASAMRAYLEWEFGLVEQLKRDGNNLVYELYITVVDAALGTSVEVPSVGGKVKIKIQPGTQSGKILRLRGKGLKDVNGYETGDQLIYVNVWIPKKLTADEKAKLESLRSAVNFQPHPDASDKGFFERMKEYFS
jgi:rhodanese-related sulfurtransferase